METSSDEARATIAAPVPLNRYCPLSTCLAGYRPECAVSGIIDLIGNTLRDYAVSADAMRWNPEAAATEARSRNSADFSLAMLAMLPEQPPVLSVSPASPPLSFRQLRVGDVISLNEATAGNWNVTGMWRVTRHYQNDDGTWTTDLEPAAGLRSIPVC